MLRASDAASQHAAQGRGQVVAEPLPGSQASEAIGQSSRCPAACGDQASKASWRLGMLRETDTGMLSSTHNGSVRHLVSQHEGVQVVPGLTYGHRGAHLAVDDRFSYVGPAAEDCALCPGQGRSETGVL